ncbi:MAG: FAD-binding oxidoreductase, partial [Acidobacteriota bacterium]|nr:FAD-binding oxidoreductase [Acidobacteriota bacterium]
MKYLERTGVAEADWRAATASCVELSVSRVIDETHDSRSLVFEIPPDLVERFRYRAGQFLSFKIPYAGHVLTRSYSLASSPDTDREHKVTIKRVEDGRISNWMNDEVRAGTRLMVVPPAGTFVLNEASRGIVFFGGGSGITPVISLIKSALVTTRRSLKLVYANRDERSIIFKDELDELARAHPERLQIVHRLDDVDGFLDRDAVKYQVGSELESDFYLCGPGPFMAIVEEALRELHVDHDLVHVERFVSPPDPGVHEEPAQPEVTDDSVPDTITIVLDGETREVPYKKGEKVLAA